MPDEGSRKARTEALKGGTWSLYYTTPEGGRVRDKAHGTGTSGHAYYRMSEGEALEQARRFGGYAQRGAHRGRAGEPFAGRTQRELPPPNSPTSGALRDRARDFRAATPVTNASAV